MTEFCLCPSSACGSFGSCFDLTCLIPGVGLGDSRTLGKVEPLARLTQALPFQPSVYELIRAPDFACLPLVVEDFVKDSGAGFSGEPKLVSYT